MPPPKAAHLLHDHGEHHQKGDNTLDAADLPRPEAAHLPHEDEMHHRPPMAAHLPHDDEKHHQEDDHTLDAADLPPPKAAHPPHDHEMHLRPPMAAHLTHEDEMHHEEGGNMYVPHKSPVKQFFHTLKETVMDFCRKVCVIRECCVKVTPGVSIIVCLCMAVKRYEWSGF